MEVLLNHTRLLRGSDAWDLNQQLGVEDTDEAVVPVALGGTPANPPSQTETRIQNLRGYYEDLIRAAIERGGRFGGYEISMPWLKVMLARLEGRNAPIEETQDTYQSVDEADHSGAEEPASAPPARPELIGSPPSESVLNG